MAESVEVLITASIVPEYAHPGDAGADLHSAEALVLAPGQRALVGTGVSIALPDGYAAFVVPRSGLAAKHGITIVNAPGTVDAGYRGEIRVTLLNTDPTEPFTVSAGDRIAQLIVMPVARAAFIRVERLPGSQRGDAGFGSTGQGPRIGDRPENRQDHADAREPTGHHAEPGAEHDQDHQPHGQRTAGTPESGDTP